MLRSGEGDVPAAPVERERRLLRVYFGIGLACSGVAGSVALLVMLALAAGPAHERWFSPGVQKSTLALYDALPRPQVRPVLTKLPTFEMLIPRTEQGGARLQLDRAGAEVLEAQRSDGFVAVLRNVPPSVALSRGIRETAQTWRLNKGDLQHLYLSLGHDAPESFALDLDVGASAAAVKPTAILQVRLVDVLQGKQAMTTQQPTVPVPGAVTVEKAAPQRPAADAPAVAARPKAPPRAQETGTGSKVVNLASAPVPVAKDAPVVEFAKSEIARPQGMSGLGGPVATTSHGIADASPFGRQMWWRLPAGPAWSPFKEAGVR